jgi:aryl-alcohol dehydrogenase-like predicted oxidoreductase
MSHTNAAHTTTMVTRSLGSNGPTVSMIGLGCMGMSGTYGERDDDESVATIRAAIESGITLLDTGDFYGMGHNEMLIRRALDGFDRESLQLSVKFGVLRGPGGSWGGIDTRPEAMRTFLAYSLQRLGTDYIDIYRPARLDPDVPIAETVGAIGEMVAAGYVRHIGLSEVGAETIRAAAATHPIADLQIEYSLLSRDIEVEILPTVRELGIGVTAYAVLSRGLISSSLRQDQLDAHDFRSHSPRFQGDNFDRNRRLVDALGAIAESRRVTVAQLAIAWVASRGDDIVPLVGTSRRARLAEAVAASSIEPTADDLDAIEAAVPIGSAVGARYAPNQMAHLDSER